MLESILRDFVANARIDEETLALLREARSLYRNALPDIVRRSFVDCKMSDPSAIADNALVDLLAQTQIRHWDIIGSGEFGDD
jgi:hypothetical protein